MLVTLVIILLLIWAAVVWSIYSNFVVFYSNFFESENYHKAYYASISALERWELVTKQRAPWFIWSGWFKNGIWTWASKISDWWIDNNDYLSWFSYLYDNANESSIFWTVNSRTTRIPTISGWDVEWMLSADDSPNYNMMWFENSEVFLLYYDNRDDDQSSSNVYDPYPLSEITQSHPTQITWEIRLPQQLHLSWWYWLLDTENSLIWKVWDLPKDDAIVDRQIRWIYNGKPFVVYSTQSTTRSNITYGRDSIFRESDINAPLEFKFWWSTDPISSDSKHSDWNTSNLHWEGGGDKAVITVISEFENNFKNKNFQDILKDENYINNSLRFSLLNLLKTTSGQYYPFLEYYADFWTDVSDKYYTIDGEWNYKDFQVNTIIQKPTVKETVLWNFTSIF